jgi:O-acetylhomoserine (thiol)-lyase
MAHQHRLPFIVDNTVATPYLVQPIKLGADVVVNSSSKYINGNSDAISGVLTYGGKFDWDERYPGMQPYKQFGPFAYIAKLRNGLFRNTGACLSPQNAFLNNLGIETIGGDIKVNYPGLSDSPYHQLASRQFKGGYGAIVTVRVGSKERAFAIINSLKIPFILSNIGDTKTLVLHPASTIAVHLSKEEQLQSGVYEDLIRISVGIEDIEDLKQDFKQAIEQTNERGE